MDMYEKMSEAEKAEIFRAFPKIRAKQLTKEVNGLFRAYLFLKRSRNAIEVWTSCCGKHTSMDRPPRTITPELSRMIYGCHNETAACPYCGARATIKETGRLGKKKNLLEYKPVVFLNARGGELFARCYWARKNYMRELTDLPEFMDTFAFRFSIGRTEMISSDYWDPRKLVHAVVEKNYNPNQRPVHEPFWESGMLGNPKYVPYYVYGLEEIGKSDFRYCQYEAFRRRWCGESGPGNEDLIKYLTAYSIYPRPIEMLMKGFGVELVDDLVRGRRKNRAVINWSETDPRKAFGLSGGELKVFRGSGCSVMRIGDYKRLKRKGFPTSFELLKELEDDMGEETEAFTKWCIGQGISAEKAVRYLKRFTGPRCGGMGWYGIASAWRVLKDYHAVAEQLGYDLSVETVRWPRDLDAAHDAATAELNLQKVRLEREKEEKLLRQARESLERRRKKYNIEADGWIIRIAETGDEIAEEGRALQHCVGGYAERHLADSTTILFLRSAERPDRPLYTIQMAGNHLVQIHGYKNEKIGGRALPDPRETMAWLLDAWLAWLEKGSRRTEKGKPIGLKIEKKKVPA